MHEVILYTLPGCPHCARARRLLRRHGIRFEEISGAGIRGFRRRLLERTGSPTVPQVVIRGEPIGGADALVHLARRGILHARVSGEDFPQPVVRRRLSLQRLLGALAAAIGGGGCGPWRYAVELVDRDGKTLDRAPVDSEAAAAALAERLRDGSSELTPS